MDGKNKFGVMTKDIGLPHGLAVGMFLVSTYCTNDVVTRGSVIIFSLGCTTGSSYCHKNRLIVSTNCVAIYGINLKRCLLKKGVENILLLNILQTASKTFVDVLIEIL